jgi:hypothetical protein
MPVFFLEAWIIIALIIFGFTWFTTKREKRSTIRWTRRAIISIILAVVIVIGGTLLNNISGV